MQQTAIVPHQHIAGVPFVTVDEPFLDRVRRIIGQARLYGHRDEFYFDGRYPGGMGMNGGIILHGDEFGIHT